MHDVNIQEYHFLYLPSSLRITYLLTLPVPLCPPSLPPPSPVRLPLSAFPVSAFPLPLSPLRLSRSASAARPYPRHGVLLRVGGPIRAMAFYCASAAQRAEVAALSLLSLSCLAWSRKSRCQWDFVVRHSTWHLVSAVSLLYLANSVEFS
ncbi:unnamed protein product [Closterium sp. Naga37s-1]|nr:unnamed protein product [Closterium sp. Naga37s-1]